MADVWAWPLVRGVPQGKFWNFLEFVVFALFGAACGLCPFSRPISRGRNTLALGRKLSVVFRALFYKGFEVGFGQDFSSGFSVPLLF